MLIPISEIAYLTCGWKERVDKNCRRNVNNPKTHYYKSRTTVEGMLRWNYLFSHTATGYQSGRSGAQRKLKGILDSRWIHVRSTQSQNTVQPSTPILLFPSHSTLRQSCSHHRFTWCTESHFLGDTMEDQEARTNARTYGIQRNY